MKNSLTSTRKERAVTRTFYLSSFVQWLVWVTRLKLSSSTLGVLEGMFDFLKQKVLMDKSRDRGNSSTHETACPCTISGLLPKLPKKAN